MSSKCNLLLLITYYPLPNLVWKTVPTQAGFTCSSLRAPKEAWRCQLYHYESQTEACRNEIRAQQNARSPWWRHGFAVNSTSEKYACHLYQYAPFLFRASCANPHRPSAGNSKRVRLFWLDAIQQPNLQLRHASFAWLYPWSYNLCRIMWRWVARQALVGDETKMRTMIIGGEGALQYQLRWCDQRSIGCDVDGK